MSEMKYVMLEHSFDNLFDYMECYELAYAFSPLVKQAQEPNSSNEDKNKMKQKGQSIVRSHLMIMLQHPNVFVYFIRKTIIGPMTVWSLRTRLPECVQHGVLNPQLNIIIKSMKTNSIKIKTKRVSRFDQERSAKMCYRGISSSVCNLLP
jgi:hypothetical protein